MNNKFTFLAIILSVLSCTSKKDVESQKATCMWEEQLDNVIALSTKSGDQDALILKSYSLRETVNPMSESDFDVVLTEMFDDDADFAFGTVSSPVFVKVADVKQPLGDNSSSYSSTDYLRDNASGVLDLTWEYKGNEYKSIALVSDDKGFLYDNIGCNIMMEPCINSYEIPEPVDTTALTSVTESFYVGNSRYGLWGNVLYSYEISVNSTFDLSGYLIDIDARAAHDSGFGWSCDAQVISKRADLYTGKYHEFSYAYAYSSKVSVTLTYNGTGFSISTGATGASGTLVHSYSPIADSVAVNRNIVCTR